MPDPDVAREIAAIVAPHLAQMNDDLAARFPDQPDLAVTPAQLELRQPVRVVIEAFRETSDGGDTTDSFAAADRINVHTVEDWNAKEKIEFEDCVEFARGDLAEALDYALELAETLGSTIAYWIAKVKP